MCREGCRTKDHASYADCLQSANIAVQATINSPLQRMYDATKSDLTAYRSARRNGIQPEGTTQDKVDAAVEATRKLGRPYDAGTDPPTNLIVNKKSAEFVNAKKSGDL